jgi:hypothetical protein
LNYDNVFKENNEFKKKNTLLQVKLTAMLMEEKDANLWWDAVQDIIEKNIGKIYRRCEEFLHTFHMKICTHKTHLGVELLCSCILTN